MRLAGVVYSAGEPVDLGGVSLETRRSLISQRRVLLHEASAPRELDMKDATAPKTFRKKVWPGTLQAAEGKPLPKLKLKEGA